MQRYLAALQAQKRLKTRCNDASRRYRLKSASNRVATVPHGVTRPKALQTAMQRCLTALQAQKRPKPRCNGASRRYMPKNTSTSELTVPRITKLINYAKRQLQIANGLELPFFLRNTLLLNG